MKRDFNLMRSILLEIEASNPPVDTYIKRISDETLYNAFLLVDGGLVEGSHRCNLNALQDVRIFGLTGKGHDFLDLARPDDRWAKVQPLLGQVSFEILKDRLKNFAIEETYDAHRPPISFPRIVL